MSKKEVWEAKAKVGDLIRLVYSSDYDHYPPGTILRELYSGYMTF